jgi:hypothetical protein
MPYFIKLYRKLISFLSIDGDLYKKHEIFHRKKSLKANKKEGKQKEYQAG